MQQHATGCANGRNIQHPTISWELLADKFQLFAPGFSILKLKTLTPQAHQTIYARFLDTLRAWNSCLEPTPPAAEFS